MENECMDLISIIIPVYNVAPYLDRCMKSVLGQTYPNLEIILVDDGATDESGAMCDEYASKDSRIVVIHQENRGLSAARNAGTLASKGKYICFVDPDDEVDVQYVELLHTAMVSLKVSLAMCSFVAIYEKMDIKADGYPCETAAYSKKPLFTITADEYLDNYVERKKASVTAWNRMYTSEMAHKILFPEGKVFEDLAIHILFAIEAEKIGIVARPLYLHYEQREDSITATISEKNYTDHLWAHQMAYEQIIEYDSKYTDRAKWIIDEAPLSMLRDYYLSNEREARQKIDKTFIRSLRSEVNKNLRHGEYRDIYTVVKAILVLSVPNLLTVIWKIRNAFRKWDAQ